jgi:DNA-binding NtrC family response regulator
MATILVIDDSKSILALLEQMLSQAGHQVLTASEGKEGMAILRNTPVNLLITDIYMPERDGIEVIQEAPVVRPGVGIIAMSSKPSEENLFSIARALGASSTLRKPFSGEQLLEIVAKVLDQRIESPGSGRVPPAANCPHLNLQADGGRAIRFGNPADTSEAGDKKITSH